MRVARAGGVVTASLRFRVQPHSLAEAMSAVDAIADRMRRAPGCMCSHLLGDVDDPNTFTLVSEWADAEAAETFLQSSEFRLFRGIRVLLRDEPVVTLDDVRTRVTRLVRGW